MWEKTPQNIMEELDHINAWTQFQIQQERRRSDVPLEYHEITIHQLRALSKRRVLAFEEAGQAAAPDFQVLQHLDSLIEQALLEQQALEALMAASAPQSASHSESSSDNLPF